MPHIQYKQKKGALHIGGGRFFYANQPVEVTAEEEKKLLKNYKQLESVKGDSDESNGKEQGDDGNNDPHTAASLKKLNADQQKEIITELKGDVNSTGNEEDRIKLILTLQEGE